MWRSSAAGSPAFRRHCTCGRGGRSAWGRLGCRGGRVDGAVLEWEVVGFGASGRNAVFAMTLFGLTLGFTKLRFGRERAKEAHHYMERAVDYVGELVERYGIDSEYERRGFLRVATTPGYVKRIQHEIA